MDQLGLVGLRVVNVCLVDREDVQRAGLQLSQTL